jgi:hypothetical protein
MLRTRHFAIALKRRIGVISLLALAAAPTGAQRVVAPPPIAPGTSSIRGRVTDSITKAPIAGCKLRIMTSGALAERVTDLAGAYEVTDVAAGNYFFNFECPAHQQPCFGANGPSGRCQIDVVRDQERSGVDFELVPGATARGRVMSFDGRPVTRANVRLGRGVRGEPTVFGRPAVTDTEGRFELVNLPPGEWRLEVEIPPEPGGLRPPVVYYPGGLSWEEAIGVELEAGKVKDRLTIIVPRINENAITVSVPPADATMTEMAVSVLRESPLAVRQLDLNAEGTATLKGVVPGRYFVAARAASRDKYWAGFEVVDFIEGNYEARLQLLPTGSIAGKIVTDKGELPPLDGVMVGASWIYDGIEVNPISVDEAPVAADGSFRIDNLFGTRSLRLRALGLDWEVAAVRLGRADVTVAGIAVVPDAAIDATIVIRRR